jgi:hypothetical protein
MMGRQPERICGMALVEPPSPFPSGGGSCLFAPTACFLVIQEIWQAAFKWFCLTGIGCLISIKPLALSSLSVKSSYLSPIMLFFIVLRATAQSKKGTFREYDVAGAPPGFQAGWSNCMYFSLLFKEVHMSWLYKKEDQEGEEKK